MKIISRILCPPICNKIIFLQDNSIITEHDSRECTGNIARTSFRKIKKREKLKRLNSNAKSKDPCPKSACRTAGGMRSFSWDLFAQAEDGPETSSRKKDKGPVMIVRRGDARGQQ